MTKQEMIEIIRAENPTLKVGNDIDGYTEITGAEYEAVIEEWAINRLEQIAKEQTEFSAIQSKIDAKLSAAEKLLALGLGENEIKAAGFGLSAEELAFIEAQKPKDEEQEVSA